jgi:TonB family protein
MPGADILDQRDPLGKPFVGSLLFHGGLLALILVSPYLIPKPIIIGDPNRHSGSIGVNIIKSIPIPQREGPVNRVANDTKSMVPEKPEPKVAPKPVVKEKLPEPDAIRIPTREKVKPKRIERAETSNPYRPEEPYKQNQVYSNVPQAAKSELYGMQGNNGIGEGPANPFGEQFGWYATQLKDRIAQKWNRANVTAAPHAICILEIIFLRDGSIQSVKVLKPSGSYTLDTSAQRAVLDANPLPPFPRGFNFSSVQYDLSFGLQQ